MSFQDDDDSDHKVSNRPIIRRMQESVAAVEPDNTGAHIITLPLKDDLIQKEIPKILPSLKSELVPGSSDDILSEIERLKRAIQQTSDISLNKLPVGAHDTKRQKTNSEEQLMKRISSWSSVLRKKPDSKEVSSEEAVVSGSGWLKSTAPVKFAVDSKTAFRER